MTFRTDTVQIKINLFWSVTHLTVTKPWRDRGKAILCRRKAKVCRRKAKVRRGIQPPPKSSKIIPNICFLHNLEIMCLFVFSSYVALLYAGDDGSRKMSCPYIQNKSKQYIIKIVREQSKVGSYHCWGNLIFDRRRKHHTPLVPWMKLVKSYRRPRNGLRGLGVEQSKNLRLKS